MQNAIFQSTSLIQGSPGYPERTGQLVQVLRELSGAEYDLAEVEPMFRIKFADGVETDAFESELLSTKENHHAM